MSRIKTSSSSLPSHREGQTSHPEASRSSSSGSNSKKTKESSRSRSKQKKNSSDTPTLTTTVNSSSSGGRLRTQRSTSSGSTEEQQYAAKRSGRVSANKYVPDGDTWYENIAVVEIPVSALEGNNGSKSKRGDKKKKSVNKEKDKEFELIIRSYFQSQLTGHRVWDEPPSGASNIQFASEETKRMAELQVRDLQVTTEIVSTPSDAATNQKKDKKSSSPESTNNNNNNDKNNQKSKTGRLRKLKEKIKAGGKSSNNSASKDANVMERRRITYKKGSLTSKGYFEDDCDLEAALKESIGDKTAVLKPSTSLEEQEAIALAQALSLSEKEEKRKQQQQQSPIRHHSDDEKHRSYPSPSSRQSPKRSLASSNHDHKDDDSMTEEEKRTIEMALRESEREAKNKKYTSNRQEDEVQNTAHLYYDEEEDDRKLSRPSPKNEVRRSPLDSVASTKSLPRNESSFYAYGVASMATTNEGEDYDYYTVNNSTLESQSYAHNHPSSSYGHQYKGKGGYDDTNSDDYTTGQYTYGVSELTANTASTREPYHQYQHRR